MVLHPADHDLAVLEHIVERDVDPALAALIRERVAAILMLGPSPAEPTDPRGKAAARFVDQFVIDVSGVTDAQRGALFEQLGAEALGFAQALYVIDFELRRDAVRPLLGDVVPGPRDAVDVAAELEMWPAIENYLRTVARMGAIDPVTAELVRLRGAAAHNCRICQSRLSLKAVEALGSEEPFTSIVSSRPTDLSERHATALAFVDAMVTQPTSLDADTVAKLREHFTDVELHELIHDVVRNSTNKFAVAVGGDEAVVSEGIEYYDLDASGDVIADVDAEIVRASTSV